MYYACQSVLIFCLMPCSTIISWMFQKHGRDFELFWRGLPVASIFLTYSGQAEAS